MNECSDVFRQRIHPLEVDDYYHVLDSANIAAVAYWWEFLNRVAHLEFESIVECGVGRARSLSILLTLTRLLSECRGCTQKTVFAFDSFSGFPPPRPEDKSSRDPKEGEWSWSPNWQYQYSISSTRQVLNKAGLSDELKRLRLVEGFFADTCASTDTGSIGILHLDGDLYESTFTPLETLGPRVVSGGLIVVDDYVLDWSEPSQEPFPGCRKAVEEFLNRHSEFSLHKSMRGTPYLVRA